MTLLESARRLGTSVWVEQRLFEVLGGWVRAAHDPALAVALGTVARHHAAHALDLSALLPATRDHDPAALVSPPAGEGDLWASVAGAPTPEAGLSIVVGPALSGHLGALGSWLGDASPVRDGPGIRVVTAVLAADRNDRERLAAFAA